MSVILQDANAVLWQLDVTNSAQLSTTVVGSGTVSTPTLTDALLLVAYILGIDINGRLTLTPATVPQSIRDIDLTSPDGTIYELFATVSGGLVLFLCTGSLIVGQLYPQDGAYPNPSQPGGAGTVVTSPVQTNDEKTGKFTAGCGHWFNSWDIRKCSVCQNAAALVCCPVCLYIQQIIRPYDLINRPGFGYDYIGG